MISQTRWLAVVAFGAFLGFCLPSGAWAQPAPGGGSDKGGGSMDFRQRMQDKMKELMAATDEEWAVLQPRIERVQTLQRNISIGRSGMMLLFGGSSSRGAPPGGDPNAGGGSSRDPNGGSSRDRSSGRSGFSGFSRGGPPGGSDRGGAPGGGSSTTPAAPVEEKAKDLQVSVENKDAAAKEVAAKLAALREERAKAKAELDRAQEDLRSLLTVKQEAVLVVVGVLDP